MKARITTEINHGINFCETKPPKSNWWLYTMPF